MPISKVNNFYPAINYQNTEAKNITSVVEMGDAITLCDNSTTLFTEHLSSCCAIGLVSGKRPDGTYQSRTLMHLVGGSLDLPKAKEDIESIHNKHKNNDDLKMIYVSGVDVTSEFGMGLVLRQDAKGYLPLHELATQAHGNGNLHVAIASGVKVTADGSWSVVTPIKPPFSPEQVKSLMNHVKDAM